MAVVPSEVALKGGVQPWLLLEPMVRPVPFLGDRSLAQVTDLGRASDVSFLLLSEAEGLHFLCPIPQLSFTF